MKITLYRYLLKEQAVPLIVCFMGLTAILITARLMQLTRYLFTSSLTLFDLGQVMAFATPKLIVFALPMATLIGVLLAFLRLNSDNELIIMRSAGLGFKQFLPAVLSIVLITTVISLVNTIYIMPSADLAFKLKLKSLKRAGLPVLLKEGSFIDAIPNLIFFFRSVNTSELSIEGVFIQDRRRPDVRLAIVAERAQIQYDRNFNHIVFNISNGVITRIPDNYKDAQAVGFKAYDLTLSLDELFPEAANASKNKKEMSLADLYEYMSSRKGKLGRMSALELNYRLALPMSCFFLGLIGAPLGALFRQQGRMTGLTLGLLIYLGYYVLFSAGKGLGENEILSPTLAMWAPNLVTLATAVYLWTKMERETPFGPASVWRSLQYRLLSVLNTCRKEPNP